MYSNDNPSSSQNKGQYRIYISRDTDSHKPYTFIATPLRLIIIGFAAFFISVVIVWCLVAYTPLRNIFPGALHGDLRSQYLETAIKIDSLQYAAKMNAAYVSNISAVLKGEATSEIPNDSISPQTADSVAGASERERDFVHRFEQRERFNLSVLAPLAAEGMIFSNPVVASVQSQTLPSGAMVFYTRHSVPVAAIYRGTVVAEAVDEKGNSYVVIQHPNDFVSVFSGLTNVYVAIGARVDAGQRIGDSSAVIPLEFQLWHSGSALDPREYLAF